jgi:hypothetical protein
VFSIRYTHTLPLPQFLLGSACGILGAEVNVMEETRDTEEAPEAAETDWPRLDRSAFSVGFLGDESDEKEYWLSKTPQERLQAVELMRRMNYGYARATARLQRVLEVAELKRG